MIHRRWLLLEDCVETRLTSCGYCSCKNIYWPSYPPSHCRDLLLSQWHMQGLGSSSEWVYTVVLSRTHFKLQLFTIKSVELLEHLCGYFRYPRQVFDGTETTIKWGKVTTTCLVYLVHVLVCQHLYQTYDKTEHCIVDFFSCWVRCDKDREQCLELSS